MHFLHLDYLHEETGGALIYLSKSRDPVDVLLPSSL